MNPLASAALGLLAVAALTALSVFVGARAALYFIYV
jgi:hypothetical protein